MGTGTPSPVIGGSYHSAGGGLPTKRWLRAMELIAGAFLFGALALAEALPKEACVNGGFESGQAPWEGRFALDGEIKHSGQAAARCENRDESAQSGASQAIVLDAKETDLAQRKGFELCFRRGALYGVYPSVGRYCDRTYRDFSEVYKTYMPILRRLGAAGWEPVTHAGSGDKKIAIERFGPRNGEVLFALYNEGPEPREANLSVDLSALRLKRVLSTTELVGGGELPAAEKQVLSLRPDELKVVALKVE